MIDIIKRIDLLDLILGSQNVILGSKYIKSQFIELYADKDIYLAYNVLFQNLVLLTKEEYELLCSSEIIATEESKELIENYFLVPIDANEIKIYEQLVSFQKNISRNDYIDSFVIFPTTDCNARCFYCYENGIRHINMTEETALRVADFIKEKSKGKDVKIRWFGGEPLYNSPVIDIICDKLKNYGITFSSRMISNGYLFDHELIKKAKTNWKLKSVQITLDGTEEVYKRCKNYIYDDPNPFNRVCNNIKKLLDEKIYVNIRLNMDQHNKDDLYKLADFMIDFFGVNEFLNVYIALLFDYEKKRELNEKMQLTECLLDIEKRLSDNGINVYKLEKKNKLKINYCMADSQNTTTITPTGQLGRCEHFPESEIWGNILDNSVNNDVLNSWFVTNERISECYKCTYYSTCIAPQKCVEKIEKCDMADRYLKKVRTQRAMFTEYLDWQKSKNI